MSRALLVVDPQCDFIDGALPIPQADAAMTGLARHISASSGSYALKIVTCDWHPWQHCSFAPNGGKWPRHCVAFSRGAAIWPSLLSSLHESSGPVLTLKKGEAADREEYSIFQAGAEKRRLENAFRELGITDVDICGLAGDVCLLNTLRDGVRVYGSPFFRVIASFSPSIDGGAALSGFCAKESVCIR